MPNRWPIASGNWSNAAIWSGSLIPTAADDVFANNFTVNIDTSFEVLTLRNTASASVIVAGGSFNFNSGSISGSVTSATPLNAGATNLITVTATTGSVGLTLGGSATATIAGNLINHTGNCNFNLNGLNFTAGASGQICINKTSTGTITIVGNIFGNGSVGINSTNGNTVITGNVTAGPTNFAIFQTAGNITVTGNVAGSAGGGTIVGIGLSGANSILTVTGNVTGGGAGSAHGISLTGASSLFTINGNVTGGNAASAFGINFTGTSGTVNGNVVGGPTAAAINTTAPTFVVGNISGSATNGIITTAPVVVTGSVIATGAVPAISNASAIFMNISGSVIASSLANAISLTNASAVVNLAGNIVNVNGKQAIY